MKPHFRLLFLSMLAMLALIPASAFGEMYVGGYMGGAFAADAQQTVRINHGVALGSSLYDTHQLTGGFKPALLGGLKIGTWFVREGFLGFNYPNWAKYFGFYLDFSYQRLDIGREHMRSSTTNPPWIGPAPVPLPAGMTSTFTSEGNAITLAFMFAARYGFLKDAEVPFGRLQPYLAVGPALLFSSQQPTLRSNFIIASAPPLIGAIPYTIKPGSDSAVNVALAVEAGVRYMALKNVSLELSFRYRYASPEYRYTYFDPISLTQPATNLSQSFRLRPDYHLFSFQLGAAYHF